MQHVPGHKSQSDDQAQLCTLTVQYVQMWMDNDVMNHGQVVMMMRIMGTVLAMMIMTMTLYTLMTKLTRNIVAALSAD